MRVGSLVPYLLIRININCWPLGRNPDSKPNMMSCSLDDSYDDSGKRSMSYWRTSFVDLVLHRSSRCLKHILVLTRRNLQREGDKKVYS